MKRMLFLLIILISIAGILEAVEYTKKPYRAMIYSALLPGGGQLYNQAYLKTALVVGLQAYLVNSAINDNDKASNYQDLMDANADNLALYQSYKSLRNTYRDELKSDYWWIGTVMFLSVADAFVDAHLFNYKLEKSKVQLKFTDKSLQMEYRF
jgi:hypothetical protein